MADEMSRAERLDAFIRAMPKTELHIHLEGAVLPETLLGLAERHGVDLPAQDLDGIQEFYTFRDFDHFVEVYMKINDCLKDPDDAGRITEELGNEAARQNVRYLEVTISPGTLTLIHGHSFDELYREIKAGAERARQRHGVRMQFIVDVIRDMPPEVREGGARFAVEAYGDGVVALGLGGTEARYPPAEFTDLFGMAREVGLPSVPHAGETAGPESIWGALELLSAVRIGHGVRAIEDPELVQYLADRRIPLEVCPTSNLCIGVFDSWEAHPIRDLYEAGVPITVNSDDPPMFNTTLVQEYRELVHRLGFSLREVEEIALAGIDHAFLPEAERKRMRDEFCQEFGELRERYALVDE